MLLSEANSIIDNSNSKNGYRVSFTWNDGTLDYFPHITKEKPMDDLYNAWFIAYQFASATKGKFSNIFVVDSYDFKPSKLVTLKELEFHRSLIGDQWTPEDVAIFTGKDGKSAFQPIQVQPSKEFLNLHEKAQREIEKIVCDPIPTPMPNSDNDGNVFRSNDICDYCAQPNKIGIACKMCKKLLALNNFFGKKVRF